MSANLDQYMIRRKVLKIFGASFHIYDANEQVIGFSDQKAFKLREDIRVFTDESKTKELLTIQAREVIDFSAAYDVADSQSGGVVGTLRRKGFKSIVRDSWEILDESGQPVASLQEDSTAMALLRRFLSNLIPQKFSLVDAGGKSQAELRVRFNPFIYKLEVSVNSGCAIDRRLILAAGILLAAIEGRQN